MGRSIGYRIERLRAVDSIWWQRADSMRTTRPSRPDHRAYILRLEAETNSPHYLISGILPGLQTPHRGTQSSFRIVQCQGNRTGLRMPHHPKHRSSKRVRTDIELHTYPPCRRPSGVHQQLGPRSPPPAHVRGAGGGGGVAAGGAVAPARPRPGPDRGVARRPPRAHTAPWRRCGFSGCDFCAQGGVAAAETRPFARVTFV
mmetsp:Transcript_13055/g.27902  ORF Transcript_13055/g.27902 Transcript_13055/m.27902 type:complete len:201 (-) Transcript_13055:261-863(-)